MMCGSIATLAAAYSQLRMSAKIYNKNAINSFKSWFLMGCVNVLVKSIVTELSASINEASEDMSIGL